MVIKVTDENSLNRALGVRAWHWDRIARFSRGRERHDEGVSDLARSIRIANELTDEIGDGMMSEAPAHLRVATDLFAA